jgi:hypothetical protein
MNIGVYIEHFVTYPEGLMRAEETRSAVVATAHPLI